MFHHLPLTCLLAGCFLGLSCAALWAQAPGAGNAPAVAFTGSEGGHCAFQVANKLSAAGLHLRTLPALGQTGLTPEMLKPYNAVVVSGFGRANADMTLPANVTKTIGTLNQYLQDGGGVLVFLIFGQMATEKPSQDAFLVPLGLTPLLDERPIDAETRTVATSWKLPFAYTNAFADSPVTAGMQGFWYPVPEVRVGAQNHTLPIACDNTWTVVVKGGKNSATLKGTLQQNEPVGNPGTYQHDVPLVAIKQVGKGRIMVIGMTPEYFTGAYAMTTLEGVVLERGLKDRPSDGYRLLENGLKWLAAPSLAAGAFGGAQMDAALLENPQKTKFGAPYIWPDKVSFPAVESAYPGVIGARTSYSSGKATADAWVAQAKAAGLSYLVFLEEFSQLTPANFEKLKADCHRLSSATFTAVPGFTIDDEVGNHYFYCGSTFPYPDPKFLSVDGKVFRSRDPELDPKNPYMNGQLGMTTLDYAYSTSSFKLTAGNYLYSKDAAPFADFFSNWDAAAVITGQRGPVVEDATHDYLSMVASGQGPLPLALNLMDDPAQLAAAQWKTVLRFPTQGGTLIGDVAIQQATKITDYFNDWHFYPDNPGKIYVTNGPEIEQWAYVGPRDYEGNIPGDFVWQNYRWQLRGKVKSDVGLKEVAVYDGQALLRRFLPNGKKDFEFFLDLVHDRQHNLVLIATDMQGRRAISGEQWDRNHRSEEFMCGDRNNQLFYGYDTNKDGIGMLIGGNQTLATPIKRIVSQISPAGTFKNDPLLGAPAFDGATGGEPDMVEDAMPLGTPQPVPAPNVNQAFRLLLCGDVSIGEGLREHRFTDNVGVYNVWHTLWKTEPVNEYAITRRNYFFLPDPNSPLAVFLWRIDVKLKADLPNNGFNLGMMRSAEDRLWVLRGSDNTVITGNWEDTARSSSRSLRLPFSRGAYAAYLDSPLGGCAVFPLTDGQEMSLNLPKRSNLNLALPKTAALQHKGDTARVELLMVGIPRLTEFTKELPSASSEVVERFYHDFGLDGGKTGYTLQMGAGKVSGQRYILDIDGKSEQGFSGKLTGKLISSLPITVSNLHTNWSSVLYDRGLKKTRPVGMFEGKAWATVRLNGALDLFIGHPIVADNPALAIQVTQSGENNWSVEVHNPTDAPLTATIRKNPFFDPLKAKPFTAEKITVPAGGSVMRAL